MSKSNSNKELKSWIKSLLIAIGLVLIVRTFLISPYSVKGISMEPTLHNKEKIIVNKYSSADDYERSDVVIISLENRNYVKRIIGVKGEKLEMKNDKLFINGKVFNEPYLTEKRDKVNSTGSLFTGNFGPIIVPNDSYFVLGDNRLQSTDSRNGLGFIKKEDIVGKSEFVFFPFSKSRKVE